MKNTQILITHLQIDAHIHRTCEHSYRFCYKSDHTHTD